MAFGYDGPLLLSETWSGGAARGMVTRVLDNDFRLKDQQLTCVSPATCTNLELVAGGDDFLYDADGLLEQAGALVIGRDDDTGQVTGTTLADVTTTQQYNGFGEVKLLQASHGTVGELYSEQILERDAMGRITVREETVEGVTTRYNYDYWEMGRLERVSTGTPDVDEVCVAEYTYDANGNRLSTACDDSTPTAAYDAQDRLNASPGALYTYTLDGSLETKTDAGGVTATVYDAFGNLLTVVLPDATQIDYAVDARGRRIGKYFNGNSTPAQSWLYQDGLRPVAELDGSGLLRARFVYGSGRSVPDYMITYAADGTELSTYRFVVDHLGSVRLVVDASTGVVAQRMMHDVWGNVTEDTNPGFQPFGFAGGIYDPDTGLVRFGARDYDPAVGRWTAKDPILFDGGQANLFVYVDNDPVNWIDPWGLECPNSPSLLDEFNPFNSSSAMSRQAVSIGEGMGGLLAAATGDFEAAGQAFQSAAANSGEAILQETGASDSAYSAYYGSLGVASAAAVAAAALIALEAATAIRVELHGTHGGRVLPHAQGIKGPGWGRTIWRWPPH